MQEPNQWHLSKSFNVSFILAVVLQTVSLAWFMAGLEARTKQNQIDIARQSERLRAVENTAQQQAITLARIDENLQSVKRMIEVLANDKDFR